MPIAIIPDDIDRDDDNRQLIARLNANSRMELLCDLFPIIQSQAVWEHNTQQHTFSEIDGS